MTHGDGGKGSARRPGEGYQDNWERIFGNKNDKRIRLQEQGQQDRLAGDEQGREPQQVGHESGRAPAG